ncbi:MAG: antiterminator LoaP [Treponema sp.]|nr:antiterminator LoaP [Treponema sp.]
MQNIYAIQVQSRSENKYIKLFKLRRPLQQYKLYAPLRRMPIRRKGVVRHVDSLIFPGYIFIETDDEPGFIANKALFRQIPGFIRFLKSSQNICPLIGRDLELALHFIKKAGPVAGLSRVFFNDQSRIVVIDGPLLGLEGMIIKVDKRKGRAKVKLDMYNDSFAIDLPFEVIEKTIDSQ